MFVISLKTKVDMMKVGNLIMNKFIFHSIFLEIFDITI
jgi:hypothetical protein